MTTIVLTTASSSPWTVPSDWNNSSNSIACIGAASSGAGTAIHGGGAAGAFSESTNVTLTPGGSVTFVVGIGGASVSTACRQRRRRHLFRRHIARLLHSRGARWQAPARCRRRPRRSGRYGVGDTKYSGGNGGTMPETHLRAAAAERQAQTATVRLAVMPRRAAAAAVAAMAAVQAPRAAPVAR